MKNHYSKQYPHKISTINNIQEVSIVGDVGISIPRIYATLDGRQVDHQSWMIEVAGKVVNVLIDILIDPRAIHNYISPNIVKSCCLKQIKLEATSLVQLDTSTKRKVT